MNPHSKKEKTAEELLTQLESNPEWVAQKEEDERKRLSRVQQNKQDELPVRAALAAEGFEIESIADLYLKRLNYKTAIPILLAWLPRIDNPDVKESVVRALTVRWARPIAAPVLIGELRELRGSPNSSLRFAVANALSEVADDSVFNELLEFIRDPELPLSDRGVLVLAMTNMRRQRARAIGILRELLKEQVAPHAIQALGMLGAVEAREEIEPFLHHREAWVRTEAKKALRKIHE